MKRRKMLAGLCGLPVLGLKAPGNDTAFTPLEEVLYDTLKHYAKDKPKLLSLELVDKPRMLVFTFVYYKGSEPIPDSWKKAESTGAIRYVRFPRELKIQVTFDIPKEHEKPMGCTDIMETLDVKKLNQMLGYVTCIPDQSKAVGSLLQQT